MNDNDTKYELSSTQKRLWFLDKVDRYGNINNLPYILHIKGKLDRNLMEQSVELLVQKHYLLQNSFFEIDGIPYQQRNKDFNKVMFTFEQCENELIQYIVENRLEYIINKPFDHESPMYRFYLFEIAKCEYLLVSVIHHLIADGWSIGLLFQDLFKLYAGLKNNNISTFSPKITYRDYIDLESYHITEEYVSKEMDYWKRKLDGMPLSLNLPFDFRKDMDSELGSQMITSFKTEMIDQLIEKSRKTKTSLNIWFISIYIILLYKLTEQEDIVIGVPVAGRNSSMVEDVVGPFVNTILMRVQFQKTNTFAELIDIVRTCSLEAYEHSEIPFEYIVNYLKREMKIDNSDLYQVMFTFQNYPMPQLNYDELDLNCEVIQYDNKRAYNDLAITIWNEEKDYKCSLEYRLSLWKDSTINRLFHYYVFLAEQVLENDQRRVMDYECMREEEVNVILNKWNDFHKRSYGDSLIELFEQQTKKKIDSLALILKDQSLTYHELNNKANQVAVYLMHQGAKEKTVIGIMMRLSAEFIISILAVLKLGAIYVPMDTEYPMDRISYIASDSNMTMILTDMEYRLLTDRIKRLNYSDVISQIDAEEQSRLVPLENNKYRDVCIIYTSGSTGKPKGITLQNLGLCNLIESFHECYKTTDEDRILPMTSVAFSSFVGELFPILCCGGAVVLYDRKQLLEKKILYQIIEKEKVSIISTVPSVMRYLNEMQQIPTSIRYLISGGEKLLPEDVDNIIGKVPIVNSYGSTETTICNTFYEITNMEQINRKQISIGKPILGNQIYILDSNLSPKPIGVYGQIYVSGNGLTKGYVNREEETAKVFIQNPFIEGERLYTTGDWGRWVEDGSLEYLGRMDNQIKLLGYRIELEEIEYIICQNEQIDQCMVRYESLDDARKVLIAYIVVKDNEVINSSEALYQWLEKKLPRYMKVSRYFVVNHLVHNVNGKLDRTYQYIDRQELCKLKNNMEEDTNSFRETVKDIWKDVLEIEEVDSNTNFFDIGGNSLLLVQVQSKINSKFGIEVPLVDMFQYPTINTMANSIENVYLPGEMPSIEDTGSLESNTLGSELSTNKINRRSESLRLMKERN